MTVTVLSGPERRRRWTTAEKLRIIEESLAPGVVASDVARRYDIHPHQLHKWRQDMRRGRLGAAVGAQDATGSKPRFVPVTVSPAAIGGTPAPAENIEPKQTLVGSSAAGTMEMEFANGSRMRVSGAVEPAMLAAALAVMASNGGRR
jgi:transposase